MKKTSIELIEKKLYSAFSNKETLDLCKAKKLKPAAVLIPIFKQAGIWHVLLTKRTEHLKNHAGQISFPGGGLEPADENLLGTAFRETHEELGLSENQFKLLGFLSPRETVSGYLMLPVAAELLMPFELDINCGEIDEVITAKLDCFFDASNYAVGEVVAQGVLRRFYKIAVGTHFIWGVTADVLFELFAE